MIKTKQVPERLVITMILAMFGILILEERWTDHKIAQASFLIYKFNA
jgi:hypothetical protein